MLRDAATRHPLLVASDEVELDEEDEVVPQAGVSEGVPEVRLVGARPENLQRSYKGCLIVGGRADIQPAVPAQGSRKGVRDDLSRVRCQPDPT